MLLIQPAPPEVRAFFCFSGSTLISFLHFKYLRCNHCVMRFFLVGFMGSGKTYWGKKWSEASGLKCYDLDQEIELREGKSISRIFKEEGEEAFRKMEHTALKTLLHLDDFILSCGGGTPCWHNNMKLMNASGTTIYLKSNAVDLTERLRLEKEARPLLQQVPDDLLHDFIQERIDQRAPCYSQATFHLPVSFLTLENFERIERRYAK